MKRNAINILQQLISTTSVYRFAKVDFKFKMHMSDQATFKTRYQHLLIRGWLLLLLLLLL